jgi:teichoic acid transport system permease protein
MTATESNGPVAVRAYSDVEQVFTAHSAELPELRPYVKDLWDRRSFIVEKAKADIRGKRNSAVAGQLWALLDPLFQAVIYFFLITVLRGGGSRSTAESFTALLFCLFLFNLSQGALNEGGRSIVGNRSLILNSSFPRAMLPVAVIYKGLVQLVPAACIYLVIHVVTGRAFGGGLVMLPYLLVIHTVLNLGLAMIMATLVVFVRDFSNAMTYISRILLFTTPVIYPASVLSPTIQKFLIWNPFVPLFTSYRAVQAGGVPQSSDLFLATAFAIAFFVVGARVFLSHERAFAMRL